MTGPENFYSIEHYRTDRSEKRKNQLKVVSWGKAPKNKFRRDSEGGKIEDIASRSGNLWQIKSSKNGYFCSAEN